MAAGEAAHDELSVIANVLLAPPLPFVPAELVGSPLLLVQLVHAGPLDEGARAVAPLRALATPVADFVRAWSASRCSRQRLRLPRRAPWCARSSPTRSTSTPAVSFSTG